MVYSDTIIDTQIVYTKKKKAINLVIYKSNIKVLLWKLIAKWIKSNYKVYALEINLIFN